jgi:MazG family protein
LGDLLLQPVYHAQLAEEEASFTFDDVIEAVCRKMMRRHPHVFGNETARSSRLAKSFWEDSKARESSGEEESKRTLEGIPVALPGLTRAVKLQARAARVGFDWPSTDQVYDKIAEELGELSRAGPDERADELGDLLFALANLARHWGVDPESTVRAANEKFERRFRHIEDELAKRGRKASQSTLVEMDELWNQAKAAEAGPAIRPRG